MRGPWHGRLGYLANDLDHFQHAFDERFTAAVVDWMKDSEDLAVRLLDAPEFADIAKNTLVRIVHRQAAERHRTAQSV